MDIQNLLDEIDALRNNLKNLFQGINLAHEEIHMWRLRFLKNLPIENDADRAAFIWRAFLAERSRVFVNQTPENYLEDLKKQYKK